MGGVIAVLKTEETPEPRLPEPEIVLARRKHGWGDVFLPLYGKTVHEGETWPMLATEARDREDWEVAGPEIEKGKEPELYAEPVISTAPARATPESFAPKPEPEPEDPEPETPDPEKLEDPTEA